jgi:hypothetical protein
MGNLTAEQRAVILKEIDKLIDHTTSIPTSIALKSVRASLIGDDKEAHEFAQTLIWITTGTEGI